MSTHRKILKGAAFLTIGRTASFLLSFVRNLILARLLAKADYGIAAAFAMTVSLLEVAGRISLNQQMIQSKDGNTEAFQCTAHSVQFLAGFFSAVLIACLCVPLANGFGVPETKWAFLWLASVPLCKGLEHLDNVRQQREMNYNPGLINDLIPQLIVTIATWPLAVWLGDYRVMVWLMVGKAVLTLLLTHLLAERSYRWSWDSALARKMMSFGWPLLLNGLLIFGCQQADQLIVASVFSLHELANYALAFSLVSIPWFIFAQVASSIMLPLLSKSQDDVKLFRHQYKACLEYAALAALILLLPLIAAGEQLVTLFYGSKYNGLGGIVSLLGAASALRFLRVAPAVAAISKGDTVNQLYSNVWRGISLPLALFAAGFGGNVLLIAGCALVGEIVASITSIYFLKRRQAIPLTTSLGAYFYLFGFLILAVVSNCFGLAQFSIWAIALVTSAMITAAVVCAYRFFPTAMNLFWKAVGLSPTSSSR